MTREKIESNLTFSPTEPNADEWNAICWICKKVNTVLIQYFEDGEPTEKFICFECKTKENKDAR